MCASTEVERTFLHRNRESVRYLFFKLSDSSGLIVDDQIVFRSYKSLGGNKYVVIWALHTNHRHSQS